MQNKIRYKYQTLEFGAIDIHVRTLRDRQEFFDKDGIAGKLGISSSQWSLFGVIWPSSEILARYMYQQNLTNKRVLEVGCGIGLTSLLLNHQKVNITATDYHPEVKSYLDLNTELNEDKPIPFFQADWNDKKIEKIEKFDTVLCSDLLYERESGQKLANFVERYTKDECEVIVVDPNRGHLSKFTKAMLECSYVHEKIDPNKVLSLKVPYRGWIHRYIRKK